MNSPAKKGWRDAKILFHFKAEVVRLGVVKALLRFLSYLYHGLLCLMLLILAVLAMLAGASTVQLGMLPWTGSTLLYILICGSLFGLATILLSIRGTLRPLFFLWSLIVLILLFKGYMLSSYHFSQGEFDKVRYLLIGSLVALPGAWVQMSGSSSRRA